MRRCGCRPAKHLDWPAGVVNGIFFLVLFARARFFADSALQVVFIVLGLYGWWYWLRGREGRAERPIIGILRRRGAFGTVAYGGASWGMLVYLLDHVAAPIRDDRA